MQEMHNSIANALELRLSCTNSSTCSTAKIEAEYKSHFELKEKQDMPHTQHTSP